MEKPKDDAALPKTAAFFSLINHPVKRRLYLLKNLPAAFFSGLNVVEANDETCTVSVPYQYFTRNPFRSTYFACLSMAAELSTGVLAMSQVFGKKPAVSMLVTGVEARFYKKAKGRSFFTCSEGHLFEQAVSNACRTGQGQEVRVQATGRNEAGELIAEFWFTWSFKARPVVHPL